MTDTQNSKIQIYTDGACSGNPGKGGWGAILMYGNHLKEISGAKAHTTNNRMELTAVIKALETLKKPCVIDIFTDSQYVKNGITIWIHGWKKKGWKASNKKPVKNEDLWKELDKLQEKHSIEWHWVKGHADNEFNNLADHLATEAIKTL